MKEQSSKKHLTLEDRMRIETLLNEGRSLRYIAERLDKSPSTISREIQTHVTAAKQRPCDCKYFYDCKRNHVCGSPTCRKKCRYCANAKKKCKDYVRMQCKYHVQRRLTLCNGCKKQNNCHYGKFYYKGRSAYNAYKETLVNSRNGYDLTLEQLSEINNTVSPLIRKGQSVYHIVQSNSLSVSESTIRRLIKDCELDVRNIDLRNAVKRRPRIKRRSREYNTMSIIKDGHKYEDYLTFLENNPVEVPQMDCVEGRKDERAALLTIFFPITRIQLAILLEGQTSSCVVDALDMLESILAPSLFAEMFPAILTDNGIEFSDIASMERSSLKGKRTTIFFCEPNHPEEKGGCEKNHEFIRYIIPKGSSLEQYSQADINLMMNHINSFKRKSLHGKSPYEMAKLLYPKDFMMMLAIEPVDASDVTLSPKLLRKR